MKLNLQTEDELKHYSVQYEKVSDSEYINKWDDYIIQHDDFGYWLFFAYRLKQVSIGVGNSMFSIDRFLNYQYEKHITNQADFFYDLRNCCNHYNHVFLNNGIANQVEAWIQKTMSQNVKLDKKKHQRLEMNLGIGVKNTKKYANKPIIIGLLLMNKSYNDSDFDSLFQKYCKNKDVVRFKRDFEVISNENLKIYCCSIKAEKQSSTRHMQALKETKNFLLGLKSKLSVDIKKAISEIDRYLKEFKEVYKLEYE